MSRPGSVDPEVIALTRLTQQVIDQAADLIHEIEQTATELERLKEARQGTRPKESHRGRQ